MGAGTHGRRHPGSHFGGTGRHARIQLLTLSDVMGTGHHAAVSAEVRAGSTVVVVGDGAVGLCAVLAAARLGAERIVAMSRHADRQAIAREFGATDIVAERGKAGIAAVHDLLSGMVPTPCSSAGTKASMEQALGAAAQAERWASSACRTAGRNYLAADVRRQHLRRRRRRPRPGISRRASGRRTCRDDSPRARLRPRTSLGPGGRCLPRDGRTALYQDLLRPNLVA